MKNKLKLTLAALGLGLGLAASVNATPAQDEARYCAENPRDCYCVIRSGWKRCYIA